MNRKYSSSFDDLLSEGQRQFDELVGKSAAESGEHVSQTVPVTVSKPESPGLVDPVEMETSSPARVISGTSRGIAFSLTPRSN